MKRITVAVDGYSSCGKSTIARELARYAGYTYVDTGAMYRVVALALAPLLPTDEAAPIAEEQIKAALPALRISFVHMPDGTQHVCLNGEDKEAEIRTLQAGHLASRVSALPSVRTFLVEQQQAMGADGGIVMDGRDIGTVVFPQAELKLFLTASAEVRATRRYKELIERGERPVYEEVLVDVRERDYRDTHRATSPLRQAADAVVIDNSTLTREEQMARAIALFEERAGRKAE